MKVNTVLPGYTFKLGQITHLGEQSESIHILINLK